MFLVFSAIPVSLITYFYVSLAIKLRDRVGVQETPKAKRAARMVLGFVISFIVLSLPYQASSPPKSRSQRQLGGVEGLK